MSANLLGASKRILAIACIAFLPGCGGNMLSSFASTDTDEALYRTAIDAMNRHDYQTAIDTCALMSTTMQTSERGLYLCANANAGKCGYELFKVSTQLSGFTGTPLLYEYFMEQNNGATAAKEAACGTAVANIRSIGAAANRTDDENYLAILSGLTNIGVILNLYADTDDDGTPDVGWDACNSTDLPDADAIQLGTALWEMYHSSGATSSTLTTPINTALAAVDTAIEAIDPTYNFLKTASNPSTYSVPANANLIKGIRTLIKEGQVLGLNYCANFLVCMCP